MSINLPNSPVKKISTCYQCNEISVEFFNPIFNKKYKKDEWEIIMTEGKDVLEKITSIITQDPKQFP